MEKKDVISNPKTPKSKRDVSMPKFLCEELQSYMEFSAVSIGNRVGHESIDITYRYERNKVKWHWNWMNNLRRKVQYEWST